MLASGTSAVGVDDAPATAHSMAACSRAGNASGRAVFVIKNWSSARASCFHRHLLIPWDFWYFKPSTCHHFDPSCIRSHPAHISVKIFELGTDLFEVLVTLLLIVSDVREGIFDLGFESRYRILHHVNLVLSFLWLLLVS